MSLPGPFDIVALLAMVVLVIYGTLKGIVRLVLGFAGLALGWVLAVRFCEPLALRIGAGRGAADAGPDFRRLAAFFVIFIAVALTMTLLARLITRALGAAKLNGLNRLSGAGVGFLLAVALVSAATVPLVGWLPPGSSLLTDSMLAPYAVAGGQYLQMMVPEPLKARFGAGARKVFEVSAPRPEPAPRRR